MKQEILPEDRMFGGLWGAVVGDALGVPVEFKDRAEIRSDPVTDMRAYGTHNQPAGTWSDDSSLLLCTVESLVCTPFDTTDMGQRFLAWRLQELWTPWGKVFDIGIATFQSLSRIAAGVPAELAGGDGLYSNGNGSLMRILPVALRFAGMPTDVLLDRIRRASSITHRHPRSQMACSIYAMVIRELLIGIPPDQAFHNALRAFQDFHSANSAWSDDMDCFQLLLAGDLATRAESEIESSGYVIHTLVASLWCLLTTTDFSSCVLKAVNLGGDTDTTGCVAGGLAGVAYGKHAVPEEWISKLARKSDLQALFAQFVEL